jgi:hypothetical protein
MKKSEAIKKWCPMLRFVIGPHNPTWQNMGITNRAGTLEHKETCCLADDCAVWVWLWKEADTENSEGKCGLIGG